MGRLSLINTHNLLPRQQVTYHSAHSGVDIALFLTSVENSLTSEVTHRVINLQITLIQSRKALSE